MHATRVRERSRVARSRSVEPELHHTERVIAVRSQRGLADVRTVPAERLVLDLERAHRTEEPLGEQHVIDERRTSAVEARETLVERKSIRTREEDARGRLEDATHDPDGHRLDRVVEVAEHADRVVRQRFQDVVDEAADEERFRRALDEAPERALTSAARRLVDDVVAVRVLERGRQVRLEVGGEDVDLAELARVDPHVDDPAAERDPACERLRVRRAEARERERRRRVHL